MAAKKCDSAASFKHQLEPIQAQISLVETEESWDTIARAISDLKGLCEGGATDISAEIIAAMRRVSRALNSAMNSERTKLSGAAIDLVSSTASSLGPAFEPLLHLFFPTLLALCTRSNKVFITRARTCIHAIIENTQLPSILTYLTQSLKDKSVSLRLASAEGVLACMNCFNPPDLEKDARARDIEAAIRVTARDASADIRKTSRKVFEAYKVLLPNRVDNFTSPLSPTMKKYLDIKSMNQPQQSLRLQKSHSALSDLAKPQLSSSTSALQPSSKSTSEHALTHGRSASSSAAPAAAPLKPDAANPELSRSKTNNGHQPQAARLTKDMPPPEFIPVRPAQPASRTLAASRAASTLDGRKRTVSVSSAASARSQPAAQPSRIAPSSSTGAVVTGAQRINAPPAPVPAGATRPQRPAAAAITTASDARPSPPEPAGGGARRVPRPEPVQKEEPSEPAKGTRPNSRNDNALSSRTAARTDLSTKSTKPTKPAKPSAPTKPPAEKPPAPAAKADERAKPVPKPQLAKKPSSRAIAPSSSADNPKAAPSAPEAPRSAGVKTGGATQPTLSQLARAKAAIAERKADGPAAAPKPVWGRVAPAPIPRKVAAATKPLVMKKKGQDLKKGGDKPGVVPEAVPLPPSPARTPVEVPLPPSPTQESKQTHDGAGPERQADENPAALAVAVHGAPTPGTLDPEEAAAPRPATPPALPSVLALPASPTRTPISTLLSSIQRGFLFTPSSPLSPPQAYLPRAAGGGLAVPFALSAGAGVGFEFGVQKAGAGEEVGRPALSAVEVNKLVE